MGNIVRTSEEEQITDRFVPVNEFEFMHPFEEESTNGLYLNDIYLPEEVIVNILSYVPPKNLLKLTLVCKKWCNIIKSEILWMNIYNRKHHTKAKKLPWYVFYCYFTTDSFTNMVKNGNGQNKFQHWKIVKNFGDGFRIENPPSGSDPLPAGVAEFYGHTSCFSTSYYDCVKIQEILLRDKRLLRYIMNKFKPHLYASEWVAGRFDCGCIYKLIVRGYDDRYVNYETQSSEFITDDSDEEIPRPDHVFRSETGKAVEQWQGKKWEKVELLVEEYPRNVTVLIFEHEGRDTQFWKGHYGSKMAGGVLKFLFESIQPLDDN